MPDGSRAAADKQSKLLGLPHDLHGKAVLRKEKTAISEAIAACAPSSA